MKKIYQLFVIATVLMLLTVITPNRTIYASSSGTVITEDENDINPIPDKYNTGAKEPEGGFQVVGLGGSFKCTRDGKNSSLTFAISGETKNIFNLGYGQKNMKGTYIIENIDFSSAPICIYHETTWNENALSSGQKLKLIFKNCIFSGFASGKYECTNVKFEFINCSFQSIYGSNTTLTRCYLGGGYGDRINPFTCFYVNYCYIANPTNYESFDGIVHVDGVQVWGDNTNNLDIHDIYFNGCRFEMPSYQYPNTPNIYVNACIMLQLEYSSGYNMAFTNCILNGGGYAVYANTSDIKYTLTNVKFENITIGGCGRWGQLYARRPDTIDFNMDTWKDNNSLYVGSVWRNSTSTSISITNDTTIDRKFRIYSSSGKYYDFSIDGAPTGKQLDGKLFEDLPFDVEYSIPEKASWIVVYELVKDSQTGQTSYNRIRYKNFNDSSNQDTIDNNDASNQNTGKNSGSSNDETTPIEYMTRTKNGDIKISVTSLPEKTKIIKLNAKKNGFYVKWKKVSKGIDGYQLQFSRSKKFKKKIKTITIKSNKKNRYTKKNLKSMKKYYVRIRTFKYINDNGKKVKLYSNWSKTKKVKTK